MSIKNILAVDIGYGYTKAVWGDGKIDGQKNEICFRSLAPITKVDQNSLSGANMETFDRVVVQVNGKNYLVGPDAHEAGGNHSLDPNYVQRDDYLALLRGAIYYMFKKTGKITRKIDALVLGLPVSNYSSHKTALSLIGKQEHTIPVPAAYQSIYGSTVNVSADKVLILPQPLGSLRAYSKMSSSNGTLLNTDVMNVVIDPGFNTFDWLTARGFKPELSRCGSFSGGVSQILREVANSAGFNLGVGSLDMLECEKALETGELRVNGKKIPFGEYVEMARNAADLVAEKFLTKLDMTRRIDNVIMTGGGAKFYVEALRKRLSDYNVHVTGDSIMMNARGFYQTADDMLS